MTDVKGELELWCETANGRFTRKVRSVGEAALLAKVLADYNTHIDQSHTPDGPPYGLRVFDKSVKKSENGALGWQEWRDGKGRSLSKLVRDEGEIDSSYLVEYGPPQADLAMLQSTGSVMVDKFSGVMMMILDPDKTLGGNEVVNVYRGQIKAPDRQIFGLAGWRLDMMSNWEVEWFTAINTALAVQK